MPIYKRFQGSSMLVRQNFSMDFFCTLIHGSDLPYIAFKRYFIKAHEVQYEQRNYNTYLYTKI